jgi:predicted phage replisome organizer
MNNETENTNREKRYWWVRQYKDYFQNRKIKRLLTMENGYKHVIIYQKLLLSCIDKEGIIAFDENGYSPENEMALTVDERESDVKEALEELIRIRLIEKLSDYKYLIPEAIENTGTEGSSAERTRRLRERQKQMSDNEEKGSQHLDGITDNRHNVTDERHNVTINRHFNTDSNRKSHNKSKNKKRETSIEKEQQEKQQELENENGNSQSCNSSDKVDSLSSETPKENSSSGKTESPMPPMPLAVGKGDSGSQGIPCQESHPNAVNGSDVSNGYESPSGEVPGDVNPPKSPSGGLGDVPGVCESVDTFNPPAEKVRDIPVNPPAGGVTGGAFSPISEPRVSPQKETKQCFGKYDGSVQCILCDIEKENIEQCKTISGYVSPGQREIQELLAGMTEEDIYDMCTGSGRFRKVKDSEQKSVKV